MFNFSRHNIAGLWVVICIIAVISIMPVCAFPETEPCLGENEIKLGKQASEHLLKESKLSTNEATLTRIRQIGSSIAKVVNKVEIKALYGNSRITPFEYTFNIVEDSEINAFSLPGGFVYISTGLVDFVQTDDELAAAIAHAIVHASHHHMVYLIQQQSIANVRLRDIMLILSEKSDEYNAMLASNIYAMARIDRYGREAERDADNGAVQYLVKAGYNPVGLLTFIERLSKSPDSIAKDTHRSQGNAERIFNIKSILIALHIPIERWRTTKLAKMGITITNKDGFQITQVILNDTVILQPVDIGDVTALQKAYDIVNKLEEAFKTELHGYDIKAGSDGILYMKKQPIMPVTEIEAKKMGKTPAQVAESAAGAIRFAIWQQDVMTIH